MRQFLPALNTTSLIVLMLLGLNGCGQKTDLVVDRPTTEQTTQEKEPEQTK